MTYTTTIETPAPVWNGNPKQDSFLSENRFEATVVGVRRLMANLPELFLRDPDLAPNCFEDLWKGRTAIVGTTYAWITENG